jgi:hypothetical protein
MRQRWCGLLQQLAAAAAEKRSITVVQQCALLVLWHLLHCQVQLVSTVQLYAVV